MRFSVTIYRIRIQIEIIFFLQSAYTQTVAVNDPNSRFIAFEEIVMIYVCFVFSV